MSNASLGQASTFIGWYFLPPLLSQGALRALYFLSPSFRPTVPHAATPDQVNTAQGRANRHQRNARIVLVVLYLVYTVSSVFYHQGTGDQVNFYTRTGLSKAIVESPTGSSIIKTHWRKLAKLYHPDKVGKQGEAQFVALRRAIDCLESDGKRWAYERFGEDSLSWEATTERDYLARGALASGMFYVFTAGYLFLFSFLSKTEDSINFWRYVTLLIIGTTEFSLLIRRNPFPLLAQFLPNRLPFEQIALLRQFFVAIISAIAQLYPLIFPSPVSMIHKGTPEQIAVSKAYEDAEKLRPILEGLDTLIKTAEAETVQLQLMEMRPLLEHPPHPSADGTGLLSSDELEAMNGRNAEKMGTVKQAMLEAFSDHALRTHPVVGGIWRNAVSEKKEELVEQTKAITVDAPTPPPEISIHQLASKKSISPTTNPTLSPPPSIMHVRHRSSSTTSISPSIRILSKSNIIPPALSTKSSHDPLVATRQDDTTTTTQDDANGKRDYRSLSASPKVVDGLELLKSDGDGVNVQS